jgi:KUP system potassium uptake protein
MSKPSHDSSARGLTVAAFGALGVVYGDIGTSPLYAFRECFSGTGGVAVTPDNVLGVLSLIFWALVSVVSVKYIGYIMRADNRGEGGVLALMTLALSAVPVSSAGRRALIVIGLFGACLLYGDGMITPAISVLSAVEGLEVATPALSEYVAPIAIIILILLFGLQRRGTGAIGKIFGPVTLVWFLCLAAMGIPWILRVPSVLTAITPVPAVKFFLHHREQATFVLGGVFLVVTGGEALYADMGHFGRGPIRLAWFALVLPALLLHYFGQGALLIQHPEAVSNPFYLLAPSWALYPLVGLATVATVVASQAVISGAFSLTRQAVQLGFFPRVEILQTSPTHIGQIYVPLVNWVLLLATVGLVLGFGSSQNLAGAYGVAVVSTMVITTVLGFICSRLIWKWSLLRAASVSLAFLLIDLSFLGANVLKIPDGGWFPLAVAALAYFLMSTWRKGHRSLRRRLQRRRLEFPHFLADLKKQEVARVPGLAVFMDGTPEGVPHTLLHNLKHNRVAHETVLMLTIITRETPRVARDERLEVASLGQGFYRVLAYYGFMEQPNIPALLREARADGVEYKNVRKTTFFLGRETLVEGSRHAMAWWRQALFIFMNRNQRSAVQYFGIPANRVVELGVQVSV